MSALAINPTRTRYPAPSKDLSAAEAAFKRVGHWSLSLLSVALLFPLSALALYLYTAHMHSIASLVDWPHDAFYSVQSAVNGDLFGAWRADSYPLMLPFGVLIQVGPAALLHGQPVSPVQLYRWVSILPLLSVAGSALLLGRWGSLRRNYSPAKSFVYSLLAVLFALFNPIIAWAIYAGHPEDVMSAALLVLLLLNLSRRPIWAGIILGALVAINQPFVLVVVPALFASPKFWRSTLAMIFSFAIICLPFVLAAPSGVLAAPLAGGTSTSVGLYNIWIPICSAQTHQGTVDLSHITGVCGAVGSYSHYLIVLIGVILGGILRLRRPSWADEVQVEKCAALLVALFLMRSYLDPLNGPYYQLPAFFALFAYHTALRSKLPTRIWWPWLLMLVVGAIVAPPIYSHADRAQTNLLSIGYLAITIPLSFIYIGVALGVVRKQKPSLI
jgi:hypothetical protein